VKADLRGAIRDWSLLRQLRGADPLRTAARSERSRTLGPRLAEADRVGTSICPYCAVGCAQRVYAKGDRVIHIEGDPSSPINEGTLCPKGAATIGWMNAPDRLRTVKYRAPFSDHWEERPLEWAMDRIAERIKFERDKSFVRAADDGTPLNHTLAVAELGGATLDNEENYLIKKLLGGGLGMVWIENQARV
jgi:formate dehydrogenase major subunit